MPGLPSLPAPMVLSLVMGQYENQLVTQLSNIFIGYRSFAQEVNEATASKFHSIILIYFKRQEQ